ncbi:TPA: LysR family transcriptional regulator [Citrobacter freundii]
MRFDLADLQLFIAIVDAGSITGGAARACLALASASERLRKMEADCGVPLLRRHNRGISLTGAGDMLERHARPILELHQRLRQEMNALARGQQGTLRLYANTSALTAFLPGKLAAWMATHPGIHLETEERTSSDIISSIQSGVADAGIVSDAVAAGTLCMEPVTDDPLVLILPPGHGLAGRQSLVFAQILAEPLVALYPTSALQRHIEHQAAHIGQTLNIRIRMSHFEGMCEMVAHGTGVAILPAVIARRYLSRYPFAIVALQDEWAQRRLCLCYRDQASLSPAMHSLFRWLKQP